MFRQALVAGFLALTLACTSAIAQTEPVPPPTGNTEQGPLTESPGPSSPGPSSPGPSYPGASSPDASSPDASMEPSAPRYAPQMGSTSRRAANRALVRRCRNDVAAQGIAGPGRRQAILSCIGAQRPRLAAWMACRQKGVGMGLPPHSDQLHAYIGRCRANSNGRGNPDGGPDGNME
jgi:hypothetical protein